MLAQLPMYLESILQILGALTVLGTIIAKLIPGEKDDAIVAKMEGFWLKISMFLPSLGINPKTKELKEALEEAKGKK